MTQNLRYVSAIGALLQHAAGQGVTKQMCSDMLGPLDTRLSHCLAHDMTDALRAHERHTKRVRTQKDSLRSPSAAVPAQIVSNSASDVTRQRKEIFPPPFALDQDFARPPTDVLEFE